MKNKLPNYLPEILKAKDIVPEVNKPGVVIAHVYHDDWCDFFKGKACNCSPEIVYEEVKGSKNPC